jgi:HEAT repeat protein
MAKSAKSVDGAIANLESLRAAPSSPATIDALTKALADSSNLVVAKAARLVRDFKLESLTPPLAGAFVRFIPDPVKTDRGCFAKLSIAETLYEFGANDADVFLAGAQHVQPEPGFGRPTDTAAQLRGVCLLGLIRIGHPRQLELLADQLLDPEPQTRLMAARAAGYTASDSAALLLRMKALSGDSEPDILAECFTQLTKIQPARALDFIRRFIDSQDDTIRQSALIAIGETRRPEAITILTEEWESEFGGDVRAELIPAIAAHRSNEAIEFLLERFEQSGPELAIALLEGLKSFRRDPIVRNRVKTIVDARNDPTLSQRFARDFS